MIAKRGIWPNAVLAFALSCGLATAQERELRVRHPRAESERDARPDYPLRVLHLVLERSGRRFRLEPSDHVMTQARSLRQLMRDAGVDVVWSTSSSERERALRRIPYPVDRGLIGWRVLLVPRGDSARFQAIDSVAALATLRAAQGHDWPDLEILRAAGLQVDAAPSYEGLFHMLARRRIDYLPRAVTEYTDELQRRRSLPIEPEPRLLLHYPAALHFFVRKGDAALAEAIEAGFAAALADGSFEQTFQAEYGDLLALIAQQRRRVLPLHGEAFAAPRADAGAWLTPPDSP